ncbi:hypothetical protein PR003_g33134 [Phytophthora rubi]|uniref:Uncharacterized protein n=1 Tax=Phytophthora rubi TaxID=129364 RepID=A0A6A3GUP4_9STRA|nr:hypothetical protein PR001_g30326 [Phytophthora rubi]KAE9263512.1 hypothetical protein PR003_g33134 [Phytophthora rubi]
MDLHESRVRPLASRAGVVTLLPIPNETANYHGDPILHRQQLLAMYFTLRCCSG